MDNNGWNNGQNQYDPNMYGQGPYGQNGRQGGNTDNSPMGIASMVFGIVAAAMICCCYLMSIPLGICAIVLGIVSIRKNEMQKGFAVVGIITGAVGIILSISLLIIVIYLNTSGIYDRIMHEFYM